MYGGFVARGNGQEYECIYNQNAFFLAQEVVIVENGFLMKKNLVFLRDQKNKQVAFCLQQEPPIFPCGCATEYLRKIHPKQPEKSRGFFFAEEKLFGPKWSL